eukprot:NODE_640_length_5666_cov_0.633196.p1 type:complete len:672 gc:universal NODE_640_length_5666_cov_0.633196:772-2787(+)
MSDSDSDFIQEEKDFSLVHALQTFKATVDSQIDVIKNEPLLLLDDSNNYWWLVKPLSSNQIGYIPAEIVETPSERLARVNRHRNLQLSEFKEKDDYVGKLGDTNKNVSFSERVIDNNGLVAKLEDDKRISDLSDQFLRPNSTYVQSSEEDTDEMSDDLIEDEIMEEHDIIDDEDDDDDESLIEIQSEMAKEVNQQPAFLEAVGSTPEEELSLEEKPQVIRNNPTLAKLEGKTRPPVANNFPKSTKVTAIRIYQGKLSRTQDLSQFKTVAATDATTVGELLKQAAMKFKLIGKLNKSGLDIDKRASVEDMLGPFYLSLKSNKEERDLQNSESIIQVLSNLNVKMDKRRSLFSKSDDQVEVSTLQEEVKVFINEESEDSPSAEAKIEQRQTVELGRPMSAAELSFNVRATNPQRPVSSFQHPIEKLKAEKKRTTIGVEQPSKHDTYYNSMDNWILARMVLNTESKLSKIVKVPLSVKFGDLLQSTIRKISSKNGINNIAFDRAYIQGKEDQIIVTDSISDLLAANCIKMNGRDPAIPININVLVRMVADSNMAAEITRKRATIASELPLDDLINSYGIETIDSPAIEIDVRDLKSRPYTPPPNRVLPTPSPTKILQTPGKSDRKPIIAHELINTANLAAIATSNDSLITIADDIKGISSFDDFITALSSENEF